MKLAFVIRFFKSDIVGTPWHIFVMAIWRGNLPKQFVVAFLLGEFAVAICCGFVLCIYAHFFSVWANPFSL